MKLKFNNSDQPSATVHYVLRPRITTLLLSISIAFAAAFASCGGGDQKKEAPSAPDQTKHHHHHHPVGDGVGGQFISIDSADKMIESYLVSIDAQHEDTELHSVIFDADTLRAYLAMPSVKKIKIMFAHTLSYVNSGHQGEPCEYDDNALTFIIAGYDSSNNYVYYPPNSAVKMVIDRGLPCPSTCPKTGTAANDVFPVNSQRK